MESSQDIELVNLAIQKLIEQKRIKKDKPSEDDYEQLLSRLRSQLESLQGGEGSTLLEKVISGTVDKPEANTENDSQVGSGRGEISVEEIVKELKAVKRQNTITHCLLSMMIIVTVIWQLSEVSLFLKVKNVLGHPFRSFASMLAGMLPSPGINMHAADKHDHDHLADPSLSAVEIPELPHDGFPHLLSSGEGH